MFLTGVFKLHNPSAHKKAVMDHALTEYTRGYQLLLDWAQENDEVIQDKGMFRDKINSRALRACLPRIQVDLHSSALDSLIDDVAGNLTSYYALKEQTKTGFPMARSCIKEDYSEALDEFVRVGSDIKEYEKWRAKLLTVSRGSYMPVYFNRPDGATRSRNFALLNNADKYQLLAALWLLPKGHGLCQPINAKQGNLYQIDTGEIFTSTTKSAILVPLEVGRNGWQLERFLSPSLEGRARVKTAYLVKKEDEYFLHCAFDVECPDQYEPQAYLGIDKGILITAAYGIVNATGSVLLSGHYEDELRSLQQKHGKEREKLSHNGQKITYRHYKRKAYDAILHTLGNKLIDLALEYRAGIVVEDLSVQVKGKRVNSRFRKLDNILSYKCKLAGVPFRHTFAAYSSVICHCCGEDLQREDREVYCEYCGYQGHSDDNAAVNIARRALYQKSDWPDGYRQFHRSFAH